MTEQCVDPDAPVAECCVCKCKIHTCERKEAVDGDYRCPAHLTGLELTDGRWVCSPECFEECRGDSNAQNTI